jgi:hypothetical protein
MRAEARTEVFHDPIGFHICGGGRLVLGMVPAGQPMLVPELLCAEPAELGAVFCGAVGVDADGETGSVEFGLPDGVPFVF